MVIDKWRNVRDAFSKSLKKRSGQATTKKYLYQDNLQFLLKIFEKDETISSLGAEKGEGTQDEVEDENIGNEQRGEPVLGSRVRSSPKTKKRRTPDNDEVDKALIRALQTPQPEYHQPDEDESFFFRHFCRMSDV